MSSIMLPLQLSDPNLPSTSTAACKIKQDDHEIYATPFEVQSYGKYSNNRKKQQHSHHHTHQMRRHRRHERERIQTQVEINSTSYPDDDDLFLSTGTIATNLLTSLKQPSKMTFNWSRQFNETLATISGLLQRNFQENPYPGCNVSEASASTATLGSSTAIDGKTQTSDKWQKRRRNSLTGDPRELDMLVLETVNAEDSDGF